MIECDATGMFKTGDVALINIDKGIIVNETSGNEPSSNRCRISCWTY